MRHKKVMQFTRTYSNKTMRAWLILKEMAGCKSAGPKSCCHIAISYLGWRIAWCWRYSDQEQVPRSHNGPWAHEHPLARIVPSTMPLEERVGKPLSNRTPDHTTTRVPVPIPVMTLMWHSRQKEQRKKGTALVVSWADVVRGSSCSAECAASRYQSKVFLRAHSLETIRSIGTSCMTTLSLVAIALSSKALLVESSHHTQCGFHNQQNCDYEYVILKWQ